MFMQIAELPAQRAFLIDAEPSRRALFSAVLADRGFALLGCFDTPAAAINAAMEPDLVIFHTGTDETAVGPVQTLRGGLAAPLLVLIDSSAPSAIERLIAAGADQVVPVGVQADRILVGAASAAAAHARMGALAQEHERAQSALAAMKLVSRAKGILMTRQGLAEAEAHRQLQQLSMKRSQPLSEAARAVIEAEELLGTGAS